MMPLDLHGILVALLLRVFANVFLYPNALKAMILVVLTLMCF